MNLTNIKKTPIHIVFEEVCKSAQKRGIRVTGSELIGLIPLQSLIEAGKYFLKNKKDHVVFLKRKLSKLQ